MLNLLLMQVLVIEPIMKCSESLTGTISASSKKQEDAPVWPLKWWVDTIKVFAVSISTKTVFYLEAWVTDKSNSIHLTRWTPNWLSNLGERFMWFSERLTGRCASNLAVISRTVETHIGLPRPLDYERVLCTQMPLKALAWPFEPQKQGHRGSWNLMM